MTLHMTADEYRALQAGTAKRKRKAKTPRPRSKPLKVKCGVCGAWIKSAGDPNAGPSWGRTRIGGQLVAVHHTCYYREAA